MSEYRCCRYCEKGIYMPVVKKTMCRERGVVDRGHICSGFIFDPFKMQVKRLRNVDFSKYEKEDYSIE